MMAIKGKVIPECGRPSFDEIVEGKVFPGIWSTIPQIHPWGKSLWKIRPELARNMQKSEYGANRKHRFLARVVKVKVEDVRGNSAEATFPWFPLCYWLMEGKSATKAAYGIGAYSSSFFAIKINARDNSMPSLSFLCPQDCLWSCHPPLEFLNQSRLMYKENFGIFI